MKQVELVQQQIEGQEQILETVTQQMVIEIAQDALKDEARKERMQLKKHLEREKKRLGDPV